MRVKPSGAPWRPGTTIAAAKVLQTSLKSNYQSDRLRSPDNDDNSTTLFPTELTSSDITDVNSSADASADTSSAATASTSSSSWYSAAGDGDQTECDSSPLSLTDDLRVILTTITTTTTTTTLPIPADQNSFFPLSSWSSALVADDGKVEAPEVNFEDGSRGRSATSASEVHLPEILALQNVSSPESQPPDAAYSAPSSNLRDPRTTATSTTTTKKTSTTSLASVASSSDSGIHKSPPQHNLDEEGAEKDDDVDDDEGVEMIEGAEEILSKELGVLESAVVDVASKPRNGGRRTRLDSGEEGVFGDDSKTSTSKGVDRLRPISCDFSTSSFDLRPHSVSDSATRHAPVPPNR